MCHIGIDTQLLLSLCTDTNNLVLPKRRQLASRDDSLPNTSTIGAHHPEATSSEEPHGPLIKYLAVQSTVFLVQFCLTFINGC